jgi:uncharacterized membrane protein YeaQ/YmgE (transglycosylase-associated protein family)
MRIAVHCLNGPARAVMTFTGVYMSQPKSARPIVLALTLCSLQAIDAYALSASSLLHPSTRQETETMSLLTWILLGLVSGFIGSKLVNRRGEGIVRDVLLGVVGAMVGGWLFRVFGASGVSGFNLYSVFVAVVGSVVCLVAYHALRRI